MPCSNNVVGRSSLSAGDQVSRGERRPPAPPPKPSTAGGGRAADTSLVQVVLVVAEGVKRRQACSAEACRSIVADDDGNNEAGIPRMDHPPCRDIAPSACRVREQTGVGVPLMFLS